MKYLKTFENIERLLHFTDTRVKNNPLLNFSKKLEEVLFKIKELDNIEFSNIRRGKSRVKKYFNPNGKIQINYSDNAGLFNFKLLQYEDDVVLISSYHTRTNNIDNNTKELYNFIKKELSDYIETPLKTMESYRFPITELNNIIEKFEKYKEYLKIKINLSKYNI
jgi:hypothetical protein